MKKIILLVLVINLVSARSYSQVPYSQDFEFTTFPPTGWQTFPIGSSINWVRDTTASGYGIGTACTSFDNYNTPAGSYYGIRLPSMNFTSVTQPYMRFDIAYAQRPNSASDVFGLWWSPNGSSGWQLLINYSGPTLITAPPTSNLFVPTATQWQTKTRSLATLAGLPYVRLAIEDDCYHGNKIYFDNVIVFDSATVGITEIYNSNQLMISPNPFHDFINIIPGSHQKIRKAELYNVIGSLTASVENENSVLTFEHLSELKQGIYFVKIYLDNGTTYSQKIRKE
ncbi:MAG TPA: T9SS type A sorting domain-containing protein [Bacteroidia bacterium]|nr:T9SS type A sorting domain-containing protein [Bacteroidia bacterium]